jgi:type IV pilus assembly protein PilA
VGHPAHLVVVNADAVQLDARSINFRGAAADKRVMHRVRDQRGFTLIELLVVILIIGVLAAISLPLFLGQRAKAQDTAAKSDGRAMVSQMETCYAAHDRYDLCPDSTGGIPVGASVGQVEVSATGDTFRIVAHSRSGNTFSLAREDDGPIERTCDGSANPSGGCRGTTW